MTRPTVLALCASLVLLVAPPQRFARAAEDDAFSDSVQEEDRLICQHVQKALQTGVYEPGRYCPAQEAALWQWHNYLRGIYANAA